jgi:hypothetical protein
MKRLIRRWWLDRRIAIIARQLNDIQAARKTLDHHEPLFVREAWRLRGQRLILDIRSRHA